MDRRAHEDDEQNEGASKSPPKGYYLDHFEQSNPIHI